MGLFDGADFEGYEEGFEGVIETEGGYDAPEAEAAHEESSEE